MATKEIMLTFLLCFSLNFCILVLDIVKTLKQAEILLRKEDNNQGTCVTGYMVYLMQIF